MLTFLLLPLRNLSGSLLRISLITSGNLLLLSFILIALPPFLLLVKLHSLVLSFPIILLLDVSDIPLTYLRPCQYFLSVRPRELSFLKRRVSTVYGTVSLRTCACACSCILQSFQDSTFPSSWKHALVQTILKKGVQCHLSFEFHYFKAFESSLSLCLSSTVSLIVFSFITGVISLKQGLLVTFSPTWLMSNPPLFQTLEYI